MMVGFPCVTWFLVCWVNKVRDATTCLCYRQVAFVEDVGLLDRLGMHAWVGVKMVNCL